MINMDKELSALLGKVKTIAVVGASDKPGRPVDGVGRYLIDTGFTVIPVHPKRQTVWGLPTYTSVTEIPVPVDCVNLFRAAQWCPGHAQEVLAMETLPALFWMQSGITSPDAYGLLSDTSITVIEDRCLMVDMKRLGITR